LLLLTLDGCGEEQQPATGTSTTSRPATTPATAEKPALKPPTCPAGLSGCRRASGRIVYVERVDPDGDGDAHFVLASESSITGPGITVIDVRADLRPDPLPRPGDDLAAAGPVQTGSYGQKQIEAVAVETG
jgi:hypothetical protein